jgi:hypothetical protein
MFQANCWPITSDDGLVSPPGSGSRARPPERDDEKPSRRTASAMMDSHLDVRRGVVLHAFGVRLGFSRR